MRTSFIKIFNLIALFLFFSMLFVSCSSTKNVKYFANIPDSGKLQIIPTTPYIEPKIQVDDILTILLVTVDPQASALVNSGNLAGIGAQNSSSSVSSLPSQQSSPTGYLVDKGGNIELPIIGQINVLGLTTPQAADTIKAIAVKYFKNPQIIVRFANFKISVAGEVAKPGVYVLPNEKTSIIDALTLAGDLTIFGKRDNILLLRENHDGSRTPYRINLTRTDLINEPYFYLRQNDYIYVEPTKGKVAVNDAAQTRNIAIISAILTLLIVVASRINY